MIIILSSFCGFLSMREISEIRRILEELEKRIDGDTKGTNASMT
jgi:hypothetical protein